ncbi:MAG: histidinol-phosphate transaminase [Promethearchaeota archaeon]|nr:MAG: histidinol-phosphate transaminase [Candidatus Lokiarchaeota archaeon]
MVKNMDLENLFRENLKKYVAYETGEIPLGENWLLLDTNENPYPPIPEIIKDLKETMANPEILKKYPDPNALEVRKAILNQLLRDKDTLTNRNTVFVGNDCDGILEVLFKVFIDTGDQIVVFYPTNAIYKALATLYEAKINEIKLNEDFSIPDEVYSAKGKLLFIKSPNDPNGQSHPNEQIQKICQHFPGIVVVDEEYADFSDKTCVSLLKNNKNLIVVRSLTKAFSLAAFRIGFALADARIIKEMNNVKLPYNTSSLAQIAAISCIKHRRKVFEQNEKILSERKKLVDALNSFDGVSVQPSDANFIFIKFADKSKTLKFIWDLKDLKILTRHFSKPGLYNYIRMTIGTEEENNRFLSEFEKIAKKYL